MPIHERAKGHKIDGDPNEVGLLDAALVALRLAHSYEGEYERLGTHADAYSVFLRTTEMQIEYCRAIRTLAIGGLVRPAIGMLRSLLEATAFFAWVADDFDGRKERYLDGRRPSIQKMFAELGWSRAYKRLYVPLSQSAHGFFATSGLHLEVRDLGSEVDWEDRLLNLMISDEGQNAKLCVRGVFERTSESLLAEYGPVVSMHAFDFVMTFLIRACGPYSDSCVWWPNNAMRMEVFDEAALPLHHHSHVFWYGEKKSLVVHQIENAYPVMP